MDGDEEGVGKRWKVMGRGWRRYGQRQGGGGERMDSDREGVKKGWTVMGMVWRGDGW